MQDDIIIAVNNAKLGDFAMSLLDTSEKISDIFSSIDSKMSSLEHYFSGPEYQKLMDSYRIFRKNYAVVKTGIVAYSDDLIALINKVRSGDRRLALVVNDMTSAVRRKANEIKNN